MNATVDYVHEGLTKIFGADFVRMDRVERKLYSMDVGEMPPVMKPIFPVGLAGAVVRPQTEAQIVALMNFMREDRSGLSMVVRAAGTSGYGAVLPRAGGIVVAMADWDKVLAIDPDRRIVRVQACAVWQDVDAALSRQGLTLCTYPSSYPSATVAGWLAQGGTGYGGYEWGAFKNLVTSVRAVLPTGEAREFSPEEILAHIADAQGTTCVITEIEFRVRPLEPEVLRLFHFETPAQLSGALNAIQDQGLPIWSISFSNPPAIEYRRRLPDDYLHAYEMAEAGTQASIPVGYPLLLNYPASRRDAIDEALGKICSAWQGTELAESLAIAEWGERFSIMRLKKLGPAMIPAEVAIPIAQTGAVLESIGKEVTQPVIIDGAVGKGGRVTLLSYIIHDDRSMRFDVAYGLSIVILALAKRHGGSAYSTGLYFRGEADAVYGAEWVRQFEAYKQSVDPAGFLNPGKVVGKGLVGFIMEAAQAMADEIRPFANLAVPPSDAIDRIGAKHGIPAEVLRSAYECARCGYCVRTCEQHVVRGWESQSPRGKWAYLREVAEGREDFDAHAVHTFLVCTTCEVCDTRCQLNLPIQDSWMTMRGELVNRQKRGTLPAFEIMAASLADQNDIWAHRKELRADWVPIELRGKLKERAETLYFAGCTSSFVDKTIARSSLQLLLDAGIDVTYMGTDEDCCGLPMKVCGKWDLFEKSYDKNVAEARKRGAKTIVTSCPSCAFVWKEYYPEVAKQRGEAFEFEVRQYAEVVAPHLADGSLKLSRPLEQTVTFHDSCHLGRGLGVYEPPRDMIKAIPGAKFVEMAHNHRDSMCCGSVLTMIGDLPLAAPLGERRLHEAKEAGAQTVVTLCPCCKLQLLESSQKAGLGIDVKDLAYLVASAAGHDIEDVSPDVSRQWAVFERMITLLEPERMAALMQGIFPAMLAAMPEAERATLLAARKVPGGMALIERLLPEIFPSMAPELLAKVMPEFEKAVSAYLGEMPEDMAELMPGLLPKAMQSLLPNYLPQLVPALVPRFVAYLKSEAAAA